MRNCKRLCSLPLFHGTENRTGLYAILVIMAAYSYIAFQFKHGGFDAWAFWNVRARFIAAGSLRVPFWYSHPGYPPLVPLVIGIPWYIIGSYSPLVPQVIHGVVFAWMLFLLRRSWLAVGIVGIVGLEFAPHQLADTPLALTTLCAAIAYSYGAVGWGGVALGLGLLIKNEGAIIAAVFIALWLPRDWRVIRSLVPFVIMLIAYKLYVNAPNDVMSAPGIAGRLLDARRYVIVMVCCGFGVLMFGQQVFLWGLFTAWLARMKLSVTRPVIASLIILGAYALIYVITPHDIVWHVRASWGRLIWHVFPTIIYGAITHQ